MKKQILVPILVSTILFLSTNANGDNVSSDSETTLCPGSGEKCSVTVNGVPVSLFDSKGKSDPAIKIVIK